MRLSLKKASSRRLRAECPHISVAYINAITKEERHKAQLAGPVLGIQLSQLL